MKAKDIYDMYMKLQGVGNKKLPIKLMFILSRDIKKIREIATDIDDSKNDLIQKYGKRDDDGNLIEAKNGGILIENIGKFYEEFDQILDADIDITLDKVKMSDIERCDEYGYDKLTVEEIEALDNIIEDELTTI